MRIAPRASVQANLTLAILITIALSWVLSTGIANYFNYLGVRSLYQEMVNRPDIYPQPIPEPRFGIAEFLTGRPAFPRGPAFRPPLGPGPQPGRPPSFRPGEIQPGPPPPVPVPGRPQQSWLLMRLSVALVLAGLAGTWLARRFTKPLTQLSEGAEAFQAGNFSHRIPAHGESEFTAVANTMNQMAQQVSDHIKGLERDAQRRRQFLADIAHELRSPVTTMRTMAGALQDGVADGPERRERAVSALVRTSERLLRLVQDLMQLARLDLNELPLNKAQIDLRNLLSSAFQSYEAEAAAAGIVLRPLQPAPPVRAVVDADRISQVFDNILANAITYAGEGAEVNARVDDGDPIRVTIADTGRGIQAKDLPYIFDSFYRADSVRTPGESHSGLGLSIARRLIEAHGGSLVVSSEEGRGTTVSITIPRQD